MGDEIRIDSDQARFNMNDALVGVDLRFGKLIRWRLQLAKTLFASIDAEIARKVGKYGSSPKLACDIDIR